MKYGMRKPNWKKSLSARTKGRATRAVKRALIPGYGKKGMGWLHPKRKLYNTIYKKTTFSLFDLQLKTSPTEASMVSSKTYDDVTSEFALGQVAFYPNGVWAYSQIKGNDVADEDLGMLPYYMGIKGEEDCGPVGVYDASWAVNKNASEKDKKATLDFIK